MGKNESLKISNGMNKTIKIILTTSIFFLLAGSALALTEISLNPGNLNIKPGQSFSLNILVSPQNLKNYTVKAELKYPAQLMEIIEFKLADKWVGLNQLGYNLMDNANGVLIKTAGYPKGFSTNLIFGTVIFKAKKTGAGVISIGNGSLALDINNKNIYSGNLATASVIIENIAPMPFEPVFKNTNGQSSEIKSSTRPNPKIIEEVESLPVEANAGGLFGVNTGNILLALATSVLIVYIIHLHNRGKKNKGRR